MLKALHHRFVHTGRVARLAECIAPLLPSGGTVLDVGCGDGRLGALLQQKLPDATIRGLEIHARPETLIPVETFDGKHLPCGDNTVDAVIFADVLHHATDRETLLAEAKRVARQVLIIKDHNAAGWGARSLLAFMDYIGNRPHGVELTYDYWTAAQWRACFDQLTLPLRTWIEPVHLYPPWGWLFDGHLHFIAKLEIAP